jgi:hypothetical protein
MWLPVNAENLYVGAIKDMAAVQNLHTFLASLHGCSPRS